MRQAVLLSIFWLYIKWICLSGSLAICQISLKASTFGEGLKGLPVLNDCVATIECKTIQRTVVGDHVLFLGQVEKYLYERKPTLLFCQGNYLQGVEYETS